MPNFSRDISHHLYKSQGSWKINDLVTIQIQQVSRIFIQGGELLDDLFGLAWCKLGVGELSMRLSQGIPAIVAFLTNRNSG